MRRLLLLVVLAGLAIAAPHAQPSSLRTRVIVSGLASPVLYLEDPRTPGVHFIVEQGGRIRVERDGSVLPTDFLDLRSAVRFEGERGLLGLAAHPDGRVFVDFVDGQGNTVVARFRRSADPLVADPASRFDLRFGGAGGDAFIAQPFANHNGGHVLFGPDGFLYIGMGDGGSADDPGHRAQDLTSLLGKMLRLDVDVADSDPIGYRIPAANPFASGAAGARREIWSVGLRNPWRFSFDPPSRGGTGAMVIGDVGQNRYEEVDYEPAGRGGRNYGWRNREGNHDNVTSRPPAFLPLTEPIFEYDHGAGQSITGGVVYRGTRLGAPFAGRYFFADFVQGRVWSVALAVNPATGEATASALLDHTTELNAGGPVGNISAFGTDASGEIYLVSYSRGAVLQLLGSLSPPPAPANPRIVRN